jgi:ubiquinone/menaquinone biosynthesis C-methylase UbiE
MTIDCIGDSSPPSTHIGSKSLVEHGYNIIAPAYLAWYVPRPSTTRLQYLQKLLTLLTPGESVLELGCGAGVPCTQALIKHGLSVTGVDISSAQIALAREHIPQATLIHADMISLSFEPGTFDAIVAFYSFFHLPQEEQVIMIGNISRWLKKGGWLLFNSTTDEGDIILEDWMGAKMFWSGLGVEGNINMLKKAGLKVVEHEVAVDMVEQEEEKFHWVLAVKQDGGSQTEAD